MKAKLILIVPALAALLALCIGLSAAQGPGTGLPTGPAGGGPHGDIGIIYGPARVRAATGASGAIQVGTRLAADADGLARPLRTVAVEGVTLAENAPQTGIALGTPDAAGLLWVLVNPR